MTFGMVFVQSAQAQDLIITKKSERIDVKILKVSDSEVEYKKTSNPDGPTFTLATSKISSIMYANGEVHKFTQPSISRKKKRGSFDRSIMAGFIINETMAIEPNNFQGGGLDFGINDIIEFNYFIGFYPGTHFSAVSNDIYHSVSISFPMPIIIKANFDINERHTSELFAFAGPDFAFGIGMVSREVRLARFTASITFGGGFLFDRWRFQMGYCSDLHTFVISELNSDAKLSFNRLYLNIGYDF